MLTGCEEEVTPKNQNNEGDILPPPSDTDDEEQDSDNPDESDVDDATEPDTTDDDETDEEDTIEDTADPDSDDPVEDTTDPDDTQSEETTDEDVSDTTETEDTTDTTTQSACLNELQTGTTWELDANGAKGQFYSQAAFDGDSGVWVVYSRPSQSSDNEDVYAAKVRCDGTVDFGPKQINTTESSRDYEVAIDIVQDRVYIVWSSEPDGTSTQRSYFHILDASDGSSLVSESKDVTPFTPGKQGDRISSTVWQLDVAGLPGGGAAVVGSYLSSEAEYPSRVFIQQVDDNGDRAARIIHPYSNEGVRQVRPSVTAKDSSTVYMTWEKQESDSEVVYREVNLSNPKDNAPEEVGGFLSSGHKTGRFATSIFNKDEVYLVYADSDSPSTKIDVMNVAENGEPIVDWGGSEVKNWPNVAASRDNGGAVTWLQRKGSAHKVIVQGFSNNGSMKEGNQVELPTPSGAAYPPYGPGVTHITDKVYFVTWSQGPGSSETRVYGRFVDLQ